jgi:hypothetical protein
MLQRGILAISCEGGLILLFVDPFFHLGSLPPADSQLLQKDLLLAIPKSID